MDDEVDSGGPTCANPGAESQAALRRRASSLETLNAVADAVHRSLDVGTVARDAIDALRRYKPFGAASILALSEDGENLLAVADEGFNPDMVRDRIPVEGSLVGLAVRRATVVTTDDLSRETRGIREMREALVRDGFRGVTIVPLIHNGRPLGVMTLVLPGKDRLTACWLTSTGSGGLVATRRKRSPGTTSREFWPTGGQTTGRGGPKG